MMTKNKSITRLIELTPFHASHKKGQMSLLRATLRAARRGAERAQRWEEAQLQIHHRSLATATTTATTASSKSDDVADVSSESGSDGLGGEARRDGSAGARGAADDVDDFGATINMSSSSSSSSSSLYPGHQPLTASQSVLLTVAAGLGALVFPQRADLVGAVGETTGGLALRRMRDRMKADPTGAAILHRRPRITDETLERAWECAPGTLGGEYARFMGTRRFNPSDRPPVRFVPDEELAYVATRSREVHDVWHVLFDCPTTVQGELALKALEFVQTGMPMTALSAAFAPLRLPAG